jgi:hypothetical protein
VSPETAGLSLLDRDIFDLHPDFGFSGVAINGTGRLLRLGTFSKQTDRGDCSPRDCLGPRNIVLGDTRESGEIGASTMVVLIAGVSVDIWISKGFPPSLELGV